MSKNFVRKTSNNIYQKNSSAKPKIQINKTFQNETAKFDKFQVVWAKISGYPWWPALVTELSDQKNTNNFNNPQKKQLKNLISQCKTPWDYRVDFIGDETHAYLKKNFVLNFQQNRNRLVTQGFTFSRRKARFFEAAINQADQIHEAVETSKKQLIKKHQESEESGSQEIVQNQNNNSSDQSRYLDKRQQINQQGELSEQKQLQNYIKLQLDQDLNQNINESIIVSSQGQGKHPLQDLTHHLSNQTTQNRQQSPQHKFQSKNILQGEFALTYSQIISQEAAVDSLLKKYKLDLIPELLLKLKQHKKYLVIKKKETGFKPKTNSFLFNNQLLSDNLHNENNASLQVDGQKIKGSLSNKINLALKRGRKPNIKIIHKSELYDITFINRLKDADISESKRINLYQLCKKMTAKKIFSICRSKINSALQLNRQNVQNDLSLIDYLRAFSLSIADSYFNVQNDKSNTIGNLHKKVNESMKFLTAFHKEKWMNKKYQQLFGSQVYLLLQNLRRKFEFLGINTLEQDKNLEQICKVDQNQKTNFITPCNQINGMIEQNEQAFHQNVENELNMAANIVNV